MIVFGVFVCVRKLASYVYYLPSVSKPLTPEFVHSSQKASNPGDLWLVLNY